jgi:hypothetical protein
MPFCSRDLCRDVLVEAATQGYVQDLDAPADGQQGHPILRRPTGQRQLHVVPLWRDVPTPFVPGFPVARRVDVLATGQQQAVQSLVEGAHQGRIRQLGDHQWCSPSADQAADVCLVLANTGRKGILLCLDSNRGDADDG